MIPREAILELSDKQYRLKWGRTYLIGRPDNDNLKRYISLSKESTVDAKHATICANVSNRSVIVMDLHSAKGTYVNGERLDAMEAREIVSDAALGFGSVKAFLKLYLAEDSPNSSGFDGDPKTISNSTASPEKAAAQLSQKDSATQELKLSNSKVQIDSIFALKDKADNSVNNSTVDSFLIPKTQFASEKRGVLPAANDSINDSVVEKSAVNSSGDDSSDESFIPETQELTTSNRVSQRGQRLQASSNRSQSVTTESNLGSQFHICTQDFNENCGGDGDGFETDSSDLLGDVQCSLVIPRITHEPVVLNDFVTSSPKVIDVIVTADDEREKATCTPDLFDVPSLAQGNTTITSNHNKSANGTPKISSKAALEIDKTATQCKSIDDIASKSKVSMEIISAVEEGEDDDDDLMPTQVFSMPQNKKPKHENTESVTLSDKENFLPSSAEDVDDNKRENPVAETTSEEDYLLPATQVFSVQSKAKLPKPSTSAKVCPTSTLARTDAKENAMNCIETEMFKRPTVAVQKSSSESGSSSGTNSTAMDASMDVLMCTPQFIKNQFKDYLDNSTKKSLIPSKKKSLFGDNSDTEELDILKLMEAPKVSRDFDTLLPHLVQDETKAKLLMQSKKESSRRKTEFSFDKKQRTRSAHTEEKKPTQQATSGVKQSANEEKSNVKDAKIKAETRTRKERPRSTTRNDTDATMRRVTRTRSRCEVEQGEEKTQSVVKSTATESTTKSNKLNISVNATVGSSNASAHRQQNQSKESNKLKMRLRSCSPSTDSEKSSIPTKRSTRLHTNNELNTSRDQGKTKTSERVRKVEVNEEDNKKPEVNVERLRVKRLHSTTAITTESKDKTTNMEIKRRRLTVSNDVESASTSRDSASATAPVKLKVSMTMVDPQLFEQLAQKSADLWTVAKDPADCDVLIMDKGNRTYKFLLAMARGIPILTSKWLESVNRKKKFVQNVEYFFVDPAFEKRHKFILLKSLEMARKKPLFAGYEFLLTKDILPFPNEMSTIVRCAGGSVLRKPPPLRPQQKVYLISSAQDNKHWHIFRRENSNIRIISTEGVMAAVMRQNPKELDANLLA